MKVFYCKIAKKRGGKIEFVVRSAGKKQKSKGVEKIDKLLTMKWTIGIIINNEI